MSTRDLVNNIQVQQIIAPATRSADVISSTVDRQGFSSITFIAGIGTTSDTLSSSLKLEVRLQDSDDGTNFSYVPDQNLLGTSLVVDGAMFARVDAANKTGIPYKIGYRGNRRYLRVFFDYTGTFTAGLPASVHVVLGHPVVQPQP